MKNYLREEGGEEMKFFKKIALLGLTAGLSAVGLGACKSNVKIPVTFVAATSDTYNADVTFGDFSYKFKAHLEQKSNKFDLKATTQERVAKQEQGQGGGSGGPGGSSTQFTINPKLFPGGDAGEGGFVMPGGEGGDAGQGGEQGGPAQGGGESGQGGEQGGSGQGGEQGGSGQGGEQGGSGQGGEQGGQGGQPEEEKPAPTSLSLTLEKSEAYINEVVKGNITVEPANANSEVTWESSNQEIATVSTSGSITPKAEGKVTITATSKVDPTKKASAELTVKVEDLTQHDWHVTGTYELEKGYGYVLSFDDANRSVVHVDFNKSEGRHEFYYNVTINDVTSSVKFQAKDPKFKDQLAADYKTWDIRDSKYIFTAKATGNNSSLAYAYLYLHNDGSAVLNKPQDNSANRQVVIGLTWSEKNGTLELVDGADRYEAKKTVAGAAHAGYRFDYDSKSFLYSSNADVKWKKLTIEDFEGTPANRFVGENSSGSSVQIWLQADGSVQVYSGSSFTPSAEGTWEKVENEYEITLGEKVITSVTADGATTVVYTVTSGTGPCAQSEDVTLTLAK